jgi:competence protein ComEC
MKQIESGLYLVRADRKGVRRMEFRPGDDLRRVLVDGLLGRLQRLGLCGGLVAALLFGFADNCDLDLVDDFMRSGTIHLLALSGMHLNLVLCLMAFLARPVPGRRLRTILFVAGTTAYVFLVGPKPSIMRAFLMFLFAALADFSGRKTPSIQPLALALITYGLVAPEALMSLSGQLSFLAVAGILLWTRSLERRLGPWFPGPVRLALAVSLAAQAAVTPLLLARMGGVAPIGIVAGLLLSPLTDMMIMGGFAYLVTSCLGIPFVENWLALLLNQVYYGIELIVSMAAEFPMIRIKG